jgi:hypothetical protein
MRINHRKSLVFVSQVENAQKFKYPAPTVGKKAAIFQTASPISRGITATLTPHIVPAREI